MEQAVDWFSLALSLFGTVLYFMVVYTLSRKSQKSYEEWVLSFGALAFLFFFLGIFLAVFARTLVADAATYTYRSGWIIAIVGFTSIPSLLVHAYGAYHHKFSPRPGRWPRRILSALHVGGVYFMIRFLLDTWATTPPTWSEFTSDIGPIQVKLFSLWLGLNSVASGIYSVKMARSPIWKRFRNYFLLNGIFLFVAALIGVGVLWNLRLTQSTGATVRLIFLITALIHGTLLAYYRVQYQFMYDLIRPSMVYALLAGLIVLVYQLGIRNLSEYLSQFPAVNAQFVEVVLLTLLIFLFQPARVLIQAKVDSLFHKEARKYRNTVHDISQQVKSSGNMDPLLASISNQLERALDLTSLSVIRSSTPEARSVEATFDFLRSSSEPIIFRYTSSGDVAREMTSRGMKFVLAVRDEEEVLGIIGVGSKQNNEELSGNEIRILRTVANQLALSLKNAVLVEEQLKLERLMMNQGKLFSLGQIATSITHDVKNPLSAVNTLVQVMQEELPRGENLKKDLKTIEKELAHLNRILSEILKYSQPESMDLQSVAVDDVLRDVLLLLNKEAELNGVSINLDTRSHARVMASLDSLKETFFNLVLNAIQACANDGGTVHLTTTVRNGHVEISVLDSGPGIPEERLADVFEPFFTTKHTGSGLGLTIVKDKVSQLNGSVSVQNATEGGARFTVRFPILERGEPHGKA